MANNAVERQRPVVEKLEVALSDRLLEIGCGHGYAVSLICKELKNGKITGIDRSAAMIRMATQRNQACVAAGKAVFQTVSLNNTTLEHDRFNKIFAVNVNLFWIKVVNEFEVIRTLLKPHGTLYLFYQPPSVTQANDVVEKVECMLDHHHFVVKKTSTTEGKRFATVCIMAQAKE